MSATYTVGIIGAGRPFRSEGATGFGMSHSHAAGYNATGKCQIVAVCDLVEENARAFSEQHTQGKAALFADYRAMLADAKPDIVSLCTWPHLHAPMTIAAAEAGVRAIHCEKPMAGTFGEAKAMADACKKRGVQLTFNHQRRFLNSFQTARQLLKEGAIGELLRIEGACSNMLDWGTHWLNMFLFYNDETPARWVMGQVDVRKEVKIFGVPHDTQGMSTMGFENGVTGVLWTGEDAPRIVGCENRLIGTDGWIAVHNDAPHVRVLGKGDSAPRGITGEATRGGLHDSYAIGRGIADLVDALEAGRDPVLSVTNALPTTEIIYATYESARRRGRIDLPLTISDSPLVDLIESGAFPHAKSA